VYPSVRLYGSAGAKESVFFFEKKNQKTFDYQAQRSPGIVADCQKFFASFFQKRRPFLPVSRRAKFLLRIFHDLAAIPYQPHVFVRIFNMKLGTTLAAFAGLLAPATCMAADAAHPYSNVDPRVDAGNSTGDDQVDILNQAELDVLATSARHFARPAPAITAPVEAVTPLPPSYYPPPQYAPPPAYYPPPPWGYGAPPPYYPPPGYYPPPPPPYGPPPW
jgi:hypothetical protein